MGLRLILAATFSFGLPLIALQAQKKAVDTANFAPGTLVTIPAEPDAGETFLGPFPIAEFVNNAELTWSPPTFPDSKPFFDSSSRSLQEMAKSITLRRDVYCLEFSCKEMRQLEADLRQPDGSTKRKLIWYLLYRLRYRGGDLRPAADATELGGVAYSKLYPNIEEISYNSRRCFPLFTLRCEGYKKEYLDRVIPSIREEIARREKIYAPIYNSVEITSISVPRTQDPDAPGVWGIATWEDFDPRIEFFSVYVYGITNALKMPTYGNFKQKALQLNFFRPGDTIRMLDDKISYGMPAFKNEKEHQYILEQYGLKERVDYRWVFR